MRRTQIFSFTSDDGLLFGPKNEVLKLVELFIKTTFDENHRKNGEDGSQILLPGQSDRANGTRILGGSESEVHPKLDKCSWFGRSKNPW